VSRGAAQPANAAADGKSRASRAGRPSRECGFRNGRVAQNELVYFLKHLTLPVDFQLRVHRQGKNLLCNPLRDREVPLLEAEVLIGLLQMKRDGIVDARSNAPFSEVGLEFVVALYADHVEVINAFSPSRFVGYVDCE